jgi:hypothetical protein
MYWNNLSKYIYISAHRSITVLPTWHNMYDPSLLVVVFSDLFQGTFPPSPFSCCTCNENTRSNTHTPHTTNKNNVLLVNLLLWWIWLKYFSLYVKQLSFNQSINRVSVNVISALWGRDQIFKKKKKKKKFYRSCFVSRLLLYYVFPSTLVLVSGESSHIISTTIT